MAYEQEPTASNFYLGPETVWNEVKWLFADVAEVGVYQNFTHCTDANIPEDNPPHGITRMYAKQDGNLYTRAHDGVETVIGGGVSGASGYSGALGNPYTPVQSISGYDGGSATLDSNARTAYFPTQDCWSWTMFYTYLPAATGSQRVINILCSTDIINLRLKPSGTDSLYVYTDVTSTGIEVNNVGWVMDVEPGLWVGSPRN